jgi:hypothetical protein
MGSSRIQMTIELTFDQVMPRCQLERVPLLFPLFSCHGCMHVNTRHTTTRHDFCAQCTYQDRYLDSVQTFSDVTHHSLDNLTHASLILIRILWNWLSCVARIHSFIPSAFHFLLSFNDNFAPLRFHTCNHGNWRLILYAHYER